MKTSSLLLSLLLVILSAGAALASTQNILVDYNFNTGGVNHSISGAGDINATRSFLSGSQVCTAGNGVCVNASTFALLVANVTGLQLQNTSIYTFLNALSANDTAISARVDSVNSTFLSANTTTNARIDSVNATAVAKAGTGTASCPTGQVAQNVTTTTGAPTSQCIALGTGSVNGTGNTGVLAKFSGSSTIANSSLVENTTHLKTTLNIVASTDGSNTTSPRIFGFTDLTTGEDMVFQFGDNSNTIQNGYGSRVIYGSYWGTELRGNRESTNLPTYTAGAAGDPALSIYGPNNNSAPIIRVIPLASANIGNWTEWQNSSGSTIAYINGTGTAFFPALKQNGNAVLDSTSAAGGDVTGTLSSLILNTVASAGTTGNATTIPVITINAKGLVTSITTANVNISGNAINDWPGMCPASTHMIGINSSGTTTIYCTPDAGNVTSTANGTANYISKFTNATNIVNSIIYDNGTFVGIGTASPVSLLSLDDGLGSSGNTNISFNSNRAAIGYIANQFELWTSDTSKDIIFMPGAVNHARINTTLFQLDTGNVGVDLTNHRIGVGTLAPTVPIQVEGSGTQQLYIKSTQASGGVGGVKISSVDGTDWSTIDFARNGTNQIGFGLMANSGGANDLSIYKNSGNIPLVRIFQSNGDVLINMITSQLSNSLFEINTTQNIFRDSNDTIANYIRFIKKGNETGQGVTTNSELGAVMFYGADNGSNLRRGAYIISQTLQAWNTTAAGAKLSFLTTSKDALTEVSRMSIDNGGIYIGSNGNESIGNRLRANNGAHNGLGFVTDSNSEYPVLWGYQSGNQPVTVIGYRPFTSTTYDSYNLTGNTVAVFSAQKRLGINMGISPGPQYTLDVNGSSNLSGKIYTPLTSGSVVFAAASGELRNNSNNLWWNDTSNQLFIATGGDYNEALQTKLLVGSDIDTYIPATSTSTSNDTEAGVSASTSRGTGIAPTASLDQDSGGFLRSYAYNGNTSAYQIIAGIRFIVNGTANATTQNLGGIMAFYTKPTTTTNYTEVARFDQAGNFGLAAVAPAGKLDVNGTSYFRGLANYTNNSIANALSYGYNKEVDAGTSGTAITINWNLGSVQNMTLTNNTTVSFTAPTIYPVRLQLRVNTGTGSFTVAWPAAKWVGATTPVTTITASRDDIVTCYYNGVTYYCADSQNFG